MNRMADRNYISSQTPEYIRKLRSSQRPQTERRANSVGLSQKQRIIRRPVTS